MLTTWKDLESLPFTTTASVLDLTPFSSPENINSEDMLQTCPMCTPVAHLTPALYVWPAANLLVFFLSHIDQDKQVRGTYYTLFSRFFFRLTSPIFLHSYSEQLHLHSEVESINT